MIVSQTEFRGALLDASRDRPLGLVDAKGRAAGRRFDVYRNNVVVSLTEALATGFPAIAKLLGEQNFQAVAGVFLRQSPPASPLMMHYGAGFPEFLESFEPLAHLGYLPDVARLELALRRSYHAPDAKPLPANALAQVPPERLGVIIMQFAPSLETLSSDWPVHAIWAFNMADGPKPDAVSQDVVVLRAEFDPEPRLLPPGAFACLTALVAGDTLETAAQAGAAAHDTFDLSELLALLLDGRAITHINLSQ